MHKRRLPNTGQFLRSRDFDLPTKDEHLKLLKILGDPTSSSDARKDAKDQLINGSMKFIHKTVRLRLRRDGAESGIGADGASSVFHNIVATIIRDFSQLAQDAIDHDLSLFTRLSNRVNQRMTDQFRAAGTLKRTSPGEKEGECDRLVNDDLTGELLEIEREIRGLMSEELRDFILKLNDETVMTVLLSAHFSEESSDFVHLKDVAEALGKPETTVRSAYSRGLKILKEHFVPDSEKE